MQLQQRGIIINIHVSLCAKVVVEACCRLFGKLPDLLLALIVAAADDPPISHFNLA
jgi:hypothetical protein